MQIVSCSCGSVNWIRRFNLFLTGLAVSLILGPPIFGAPPRETRQTYFLVLDGEPVGEVHSRLKNTHSAQQVESAVSDRHAAINAQQDALIAPGDRAFVMPVEVPAGVGDPDGKLPGRRSSNPSRGVNLYESGLHVARYGMGNTIEEID